MNIRISWITIAGLCVAGLLGGCEGTNLAECFDRADNDGDGAIDCLDPGCAAYCTGDIEVCDPGELQECPCGGGADGVQECEDNGEGWGECDCDGPGDDDGGDDDVGDDDAGDDDMGDDDLGDDDMGDDDLGDDDMGDDDVGDDDTGGPDPIIGNWISTIDIGGYYDEMHVAQNLNGTATLYFYMDNDPYVADFDISTVSYNPGIHYDLWFEYSALPELDFTFSCAMPNQDFLQCVGDGLWAKYAIDFDRN